MIFVILKSETRKKNRIRASCILSDIVLTTNRTTESEETIISKSSFHLRYDEKEILVSDAGSVSLTTIEEFATRKDF